MRLVPPYGHHISTVPGKKFEIGRGLFADLIPLLFNPSGTYGFCGTVFPRQTLRKLSSGGLRFAIFLVDLPGANCSCDSPFTGLAGKLEMSGCIFICGSLDFRLDISPPLLSFRTVWRGNTVH
jgi:hypothetical protein